MNYQLTFANPRQHLIRIEMRLEASGNQETRLHLSKWRPGRYEIAPYIENIVDVSAQTRSGRSLEVDKKATHTWAVAPSGGEAILFSYSYYANTLDAGSSYFDEEQVYINGVNLFMHQEGRIDEACEFTLDLPDNYDIACGLRRNGNTFYADDFHQLTDAPLFAGANMLHHKFSAQGIPFHLWFLGEVKPDLEKIEKEFKSFSEAQLDLFGEFPVDQYHFLFLVRGDKFYHGVEHHNSTVIAIGPGYNFMKEALYEDVLGVSSHELFHTWNVKALRPADMVPYQYDDENYSKLHYVTEGVTTYYGDLMLLKSGVWDLKNFIKVFNESNLDRHHKNNGKDHISLEQASFDSWIYGYKAGVPNRKISFYTKGALAAFILDCRIRRLTDHRSSLDQVMAEMYQRFGKTGTGYTRDDYQGVIEELSGASFDDYFRDVISGTVDLDAALTEAAEFLGLEYGQVPQAGYSLSIWGFQTDEESGIGKVSQVFENSPAAQAGLRNDDEIIAVNGRKVENQNLQDLIRHFHKGKEVELQFFRRNRLNNCRLVRDNDFKHTRGQFQINAEASPEQLRNREEWMKVHKREAVRD